MQIFCPAAAAVAEVHAMGNQPLMQVAGEQRDAVGAQVVAEAVAGHADLAAAAFSQHVLIEPGPIFNLLVAGWLQTGEGNRHHGNFCGHTPILAGGCGAMWDQPSPSSGLASS
jgi:selenophosphate synthase